MNRLDRYFFAELIRSTSMVLLAFAALYILLTVLDEQSDLRYGNQWGTVAMVVAYTLPTKLYEIAPIIILIAWMLAIGGLSARSELTAMLASGISMRGLMISMSKTLLISLAFFVALGEWLGPIANTQGQNLKNQALGVKVMDDGKGLWMKSGNTFLLVDKAFADGRLVGAQLFIEKNGRLERMIEADTLVFEKNQWVATQAYEKRYQTEFWPNVQVEQKQYEQAPIQLDLSPDLFKSALSQPQDMSVLELWDYVHFMRSNGLYSGMYEYALWKKFMMPLTVIGLLLWVFPMLLGSMRHVSVGQKVFVGVLVGLVFFLVDKILVNVTLAYQLPALLGVSVLPVLLLVWAMIRLKHSN